MKLTGFGGWQEEQAEPEPEVPQEFMFDADMTVWPPHRYRAMLTHIEHSKNNGVHPTL